MILNIITTHDWIPNRVNVPYLYYGLCLISTFYTRRVICYLSFGQVAYDLPGYLFMKDPTGQTQVVYLRDVRYDNEIFQDLLNQPNAQASRLRLFNASHKYENNKQLYNVIKEDFYTHVRTDYGPHQIFEYVEAFFRYRPVDEEVINFIFDLCEKRQDVKICVNNIARFNTYIIKALLPNLSYRLLDRLSNVLYKPNPIHLQITKYKILQQQGGKHNNDV